MSKIRKKNRRFFIYFVDMFRIAFSPVYTHPLPENHRFPMEKYDLLYQQLLHEGIATAPDFFEPGLCEERFILKAHDFEYWSRLKNLKLSKQEIRKTGFPMSWELIEREVTLVQGSIECVDYAMVDGVSMNIAGGTHHAARNRGEGFCLLNDLAIAAYYALENKSVSQVLMLDLDVHQGDGSAHIFNGIKEVFTFSMHGKNNFPLRKEMSDLDIELPDGTKDQEYLDILEAHLHMLFTKVKPQFVCYQSGVDVLASDKLGKLNLSIEGCKERDRMVLEATHQNHIPLIAAMGGGYSPRIRDIVNAHTNTYRLAKEIYF